MALLGSTVDPRLFIQDYSGFVDAAKMQAQGMMNLGQSIGQGIEKYQEAKKERQKLDASIKANRKSIESALKLGESLGINVSSLNPILEQMDDPNVTPMEAAALGQAGVQRITDTLNLGIGLQDRKIKEAQAAAEAGYRERMATAAETKAKASLMGVQQKARAITSEEVSVVNAATGEKDSVLINRDAQGRMRDPVSGKPIKDLFKFANEIEGWEAPEEPAMPPTSQVGGNASDLIASAAQMNIGKLSTAKTPGTQGGNLGCADAICRTFKQATGEELVPGGTLSTREMAANLADDPRFIKVSLNEAQKGDIVLTPGKGTKAGHTGIVLDGGVIASNSSKGFAGEAPGTFVQNYTIDSWQRNVAPRNPKETAAYRYIGSQDIDNALAMGGDMTQQAMGTPQQQAEAARMIEQGAGMATAQNIPQGAMQTESSMTNQQPQLPQQAKPQVNRRLLSSRKRSGVIMTKEQVEELKQSGNDFTAEPVEGGNYLVTQIRGSNTNYDRMRIDVATARKLYEEGKPKEALDLMVAMKFSSPFGAAVDMNTLELLWGPPGVPKAPDTPVTPTVPKAPDTPVTPTVPLPERVKQLIQ